VSEQGRGQERGQWHGTTILAVRKGDKIVIAGDGQVSVGQTIMKANAKKVRPLADGRVIAGFAGATADALTLFERLEQKLERFPAQLARACVELAKDWRTDRALRRLEAMMIVADARETLLRRCAGAGISGDRGRLRGQLRAGRRPRALSPCRRRRGDCASGDGDRGRYLRLHQPQSDAGDAGERALLAKRKCRFG
jgi:ATP-dependent HslUV protease subunit HslV